MSKDGHSTRKYDCTEKRMGVQGVFTIEHPLPRKRTKTSNRAAKREWIDMRFGYIAARYPLTTEKLTL